MAKERWLPVCSFPDYVVSDLGRVRRVAGTACDPQKILVGGMSKGYRAVLLRRTEVVEGECVRKRYFIRVHRMVAEAFLPGDPQKTAVNHKNGDKLDNRLSNLEWCTLSENAQHAHRLGLNPVFRGSENPQAKLSEKQVKEIYELLQLGMTRRELATRFAVSEAAIHGIETGKAWCHVTGLIDRNKHPESGRKQLLGKACGERHVNSKLSYAQVREIRRQLDNGVSQDALAAIFGVAQTTISHIKRNLTWKVAR